MKRLLILSFAALLLGYSTSSCSSSSSDKAKNDSIAAAQLEAARLDSIRQDSIERRNFTTPDLAFKELHGHVEKCEWGTENNLYYPTVYTYSIEGNLVKSNDEDTRKYNRDRNGQIVEEVDGYYELSFGWSDYKVSKEQLVMCEGETAYGGGDIHYFYDNNGLLSYTTTDGGEGENGTMRNMKTVYSDYEFDDMGNWISRKSTTTYQVDELGNGSWENHTETNKEVRVITYYDSEIGRERQGLLSQLHDKRYDEITSKASQSNEQEDNGNIPSWIQGVWHLDIDGPNGIAVSNYTITISGNYATFVDGRTTKYDGECHVEDGYLYLGSYKRYKIDGKSLVFMGHRLTKDGEGSSFNGTFRTDSDVMRYLTDRTFYSDSHRMAFTYNGVTIDGYTVSGAPRISRFSSSSATITVYPLGGGRAVSLYLNASNGTINYDGDIFRAR